jgi:hypothetical protein
MQYNNALASVPRVCIVASAMTQTTIVNTLTAEQRMRGFWTPVRDSEAWDTIWGMLRERWGDTKAEDEQSGECWQMMGVVLSDDGAHWHAEFRHRMHPGTGRREYYRVELSADFVTAFLPPEQRDEQVRRVSARAVSEQQLRERTRAQAMSRPAPSFPRPLFRECDCSGVFDGNTVYSDADPGL